MMLRPGQYYREEDSEPALYINFSIRNGPQGFSGLDRGVEQILYFGDRLYLPTPRYCLVAR